MECTIHKNQMMGMENNMNIIIKKNWWWWAETP